MSTTFQIPNGGPLLENVTPGSYITVNATGDVYEHNTTTAPRPLHGCSIWGAKPPPTIPTRNRGQVTDAWLDANNWRQACWQVPEPLRVGYYRSKHGLMYVATTTAPGDYPIITLASTHLGVKWGVNMFSHPFSAKGWKYIGETL